MVDQDEFSCPFCDFVIQDSYFLIQHVELVHPEGGKSPFIAQDGFDQSGNGDSGQSSEGAMHSESTVDSTYVQCPYDCGEKVLASDLTSHTDFHVAERIAIDEVDAVEPPGVVAMSTGPCNDLDAVKDITNRFTTDLPRALRNRHKSRPNPRKGGQRWSFREFLLGSPDLPERYVVKKTIAAKEKSVRRLGKAELGPYAHEQQMPAWLRDMLEEGAKVTVYNKIGADGTVIRVEAVANETSHLVPVLSRLSELDPSVERAFYCSPEVKHIVKLPNEGGFCGYRNIQMLISYIRDAQVQGHEHFKEKKIPSILKLQDMIEQAWEMGFNSTGKIETGGIRGTRKYIGTPEVHGQADT